MSLRSVAAADNRKILNNDGDAVKLTIDGYEFNLIGQVIRIDAVIDPQSGMQVVEPKTAITVSIADLPADPETGWRVETTDATGAALIGTVADVRQDRTLGFVNLILEVNEDA